MPIVFASPLSATTSGGLGIASPRRMSWTGFDGSVWPLTRPQAQNPRMAPGVKGLHMPPVSVFKSATPLVAGVEMLGYTLGERPVYWPLLFRAADVVSWEEEHAAFFDSFHPVEPGVWTVGSGDAARTLELTGVFDGSYAFGRDPFLSRFALIGIELTAPRPLWRGLPVSRTFLGASGQDFIPEDGAPDFYISPSSTFAEATIDNPGNEPAYLTWTVEGPNDDVILGVGGALIEVPFAVAEDSVLVIDTDPAGQFATLDGVDVTRDLGFQMFAPVPARGTTPLVISATGGGSVRASLVPLYWRAF